MKLTVRKCVLGTLLFFTARAAGAAPGQFSISIGAIGAIAGSSIPLSAYQGVGAAGSVEYRFSDFFAGGISGGLVEFIASPNASIADPTVYQKQDMKTSWLDLTGRFFPLPASPLGEVYFQLGFGVSPHLANFPDYFPNYTSQIFPGPQFSPETSGTLNWDAQASLGYLFNLGGGQGLDLGLQTDTFWPPADRSLQTLGLRAEMVFFIGGPKAAEK